MNGQNTDCLLFQNKLYSGLAGLYPEDYNPGIVNAEHSGKLQTLAQMLASMYSSVPRQRVVVVSNYTQVRTQYSTQTGANPPD